MYTIIYTYIEYSTFNIWPYLMTEFVALALRIALGFGPRLRAKFVACKIVLNVI